MIDQTESLIIAQARARASAKRYVVDKLGAQFDVLSVERLPDCWWARVYTQPPHAPGPLLVGHLRVGLASGAVVPLSPADLDDMAARAVVLAAQRNGELARNAEGYIHPYQARLKAASYVASEITFYGIASVAPEWIGGEHPRWRVATSLQLPTYGRVCDLGTVDVDAVTGAVIPLTPAEIQTRQKRANDAAQAVEHSTATSS